MHMDMAIRARVTPVAQRGARAPIVQPIARARQPGPEGQSHTRANQGRGGLARVGVGCADYSPTPCSSTACATAGCATS
eukprot:6754693-Prymnesium_polylepis.1